MMPVVVLCGGLATRLHGIGETRPKALAEVSGKAFLHYLLADLKRQGIADVILSTGHLSHMIEEFAGDGSQWGLRLRQVAEPRPLGTGGALRFVTDFLNLDEPIFALNGDTFFSGLLEHLATRHRSRGDAAASIALVKVADASRYGTVNMGLNDDRVRSFSEKSGESGPAWINAGAYVLEPSLLASIDLNAKVSIERDVFPQWVGRGLYGCTFPDAAFVDIGTPEDLARAPEMLRAFERSDR